MNEFWQQLHLLRPAWLLALPLLWWLIYRARRQGAGNPWSRVVDPELLPHLLEQGRTGSDMPLWLAGLGATLAILALSGPAWRQLPQPVYDAPLHRVLVMELTEAMNAADLKPNRLQRARLIAHQLLQRQSEGETALVSFAGSAFPVVPLTRDDGTVRHLLDSLDSSLMPVPGQNTAAAIDTAVELLSNAGAERGDIVLFITGGADGAARMAAEKASQRGYRVHVLAAGTEEGAPVPAPGGGWRRDDRGGIALARIDEAALRALAAAGAGRYARIDRIDAQWSLAGGPDWSADPQQARDDFQADLWQDEGPWLLLPLLLIAALGFRRGWLTLLLIGLPLATPGPARADLWRNADQAGQALLQQGDAAAAAETFRSPQWRASALYEAGDYAAAAALWGKLDSASAAYNRGNALARAGELEQALAAYDEALAREPDLADAQANRQLIEELLRQQQEQQGENRESGENEQDQASSGEDQQSGQSDQSGDPSQGDRSDESGENQGQSDSAAQDQASQQNSNAEDEAQTGEDDRDAQPDEPRSPEEAGQTGEQSEQALSEADARAREQEQAVRQWLNRIEDDPGRLLREKFRRMQERRLRGEER